MQVETSSKDAVPKKPISPEKKKDLEKQGYRIVEDHSAIKVCMWTKNAIRGEGVCYKQKFYGINAHKCVQMTPALPNCTLRCNWCWRDINHTMPKWYGEIDKPEKIVEGCVKQHVKYLEGFKGNKGIDQSVYNEATKPLHFAISLAGEPTLYPRLPELIKEIHKQGMTSFLVTNATVPEMLRKLKNNLPTQLYITLPAPNKEIFTSVCNPIIPDAWENILESLKVMKEYKGKTRTTIRLTVTKNQNMMHPEQYAELIKKANPLFVEVKAYVYVGYSQKRLEINNMPTHEEVKRFSKQLADSLGYKIIDEYDRSRVCLLMKEDIKDRVMEF